MKLALIPGQGRISLTLSTSPFPEKEAWLQTAADLLGFPVTSDSLKDHVVEQVMIVAHAFACHDYFVNHGGKLDGVCGYSIGQYGALGISGILDKRLCLELVKERAEMLAKCSSPSMGMLGVLGLDEAITVESVKQLREANTYSDNYFAEISNFNTRYSQSVAGEISLLKILREVVLKKGAAKAELLEVQGAWHSRMLSPMKKDFNELLSHFQLNRPNMYFADNVTGSFQNETNEIRRLLVDHLTEPVQWRKSIATLQTLKPSLVMEWSPEDQLQKMLLFSSPPMRAVSWKTQGEINRCVESPV